MTEVYGATDPLLTTAAGRITRVLQGIAGRAARNTSPSPQSRAPNPHKQL